MIYIKVKKTIFKKILRNKFELDFYNTKTIGGVISLCINNDCLLSIHRLDRISIKTLSASFNPKAFCSLFLFLSLKFSISTEICVSFEE